MPTKIKPDFQPTERTYNNLRKHGALPEFVDYELEMFIGYFLDPELPESKAYKESWQMTCQRWMREAWKGSAGKRWEQEREFRMSHRRDSPAQGDIFDTALKGLQTPPKPLKPKPAVRVVHTPIPGEGETMSAEEAIKAMRAMRR